MLIIIHSSQECLVLAESNMVLSHTAANRSMTLPIPEGNFTYIYTHIYICKCIYMYMKSLSDKILLLGIL